jgi:hypothetical protein
VLGFSVEVRGQLQQWRERVEQVSRRETLGRPAVKEFKAKNGLPELECYRGVAPNWFWEQFPVNTSTRKSSWICANKLRNVAAAVGCSDTVALELVCHDLQHGADVGCEGGCRAASRSKNAASVQEFPREITDAICSWVKSGIVRGPVAEEDVPKNAKVNGIMCRKKPNGAARIIVNMSSPMGYSVNDGIDATKFPAKMSSTGKWLEVLHAVGKGCKMLKLDWAEAYKHVPVREEDLHLQWFEWLGMYFVELCLVFGTASSVGIFDRLAKVFLDLVLRWSKFPREWVCQHLDDVCAAAPAASQCLEEFEKVYRGLAEQVGVRLAPTSDPDKAFSPCQEGVVLGVWYNTEKWTWAIPHDKLVRLVWQIRSVMVMDWVRQDEIWSLAGRILHYAPLVPGGRFNLDYILRANSQSEIPTTLVQVTAELKRQLEFWRVMTMTSSGHSRIPVPEGRPAPWARQVYTDAAGGSMVGHGRGAGAVMGDWWVYVNWGWRINSGSRADDGKKISRKMSALELVGPLVALAAGADWCRSKSVRIWVDNIGSVRIWKKGYSTNCQLCTTLVKAIATVAAGLGCMVHIDKVTRCSSTGAILADALSKADFVKFRDVARVRNWELRREPAWVPVSVLQWIDCPRVDDDLGEKILCEISRSTPVLGYSC